MTAEANFCPKCGAALTANMRFCAQCGDQFAGDVAAGFWIRLVAVLIDAVILTAVAATIEAIIDYGFFASLAVGATYQIGFWTAAGATPGKMLMKLKVVDEEGEQVQIDKAILRYVGYWVSTIVLLIGFLMIAFRQDHRGLHDLIAGTNVIRTE